MADPVRDFALDEDGDIDITGNDFNVVAGREATQQGAQIRVKFYYQECYLDESLGIRWVERLGSKTTDPIVLREEVREAIAETPDILEVVGTQIVEVNRRGRVRYSYRDVYTRGAVSNETVV